MSDYTIQKIDAENFPLLIPLMKDCFGMDVNIDYFRWKYLENPAGCFIGFVAIENTTHEVGGYYGVIPQLFSVEGKERTIYQSCDTMTHSKHRRKGLFQMLALHCYEYIKNNHYFFLIGFGGGQSTPGFIKFGWQSIFRFKYYFKPYWFCRLSGFKKYARENFCEDEPLENLEQLTIALQIGEKIKAIRTVGHLQWRIKNPLYNYKIVSHRESGKLTGYVIYYVQNNKIFLFDFAFNSSTSGNALLWYLSDITIRNNYKGIVAFCQENGAQSAYLKNSLFISNPFGKGPLHEATPFIFYSDKATMKRFLTPDKWEMTSYDHDAL